MLEHVGVDVRYIDSRASLADKLREPDTVACENNVSRLLQRVMQFGRDIKGRQRDILYGQLRVGKIAFTRLTTNWNSAYGKNKWNRMYSVWAVAIVRLGLLSSVVGFDSPTHNPQRTPTCSMKVHAC